MITRKEKSRWLTFLSYKIGVVLFVLLASTVASAAAIQPAFSISQTPANPISISQGKHKKITYAVSIPSTSRLPKTGINTISASGFPAGFTTSGCTPHTTVLIKGGPPCLFIVDVKTTNSTPATSYTGSMSVTPTTNTFAGASVVTPVTVTSALNSITVTAASSTIVQGATDQLTAMGTYNNGSQNITSQVIWSAPEGSGVSISPSGLATIAFLAPPGPVTVTASLAGVQGTTPITITHASLVLSNIVVSPTSGSVAVGAQTSAFTVASCAYSNSPSTTCPTDMDATWGSSDEGVATVDTTTGIATGVGIGSANITATYQGVTSSPGATVSVVAPVLSDIVIAPLTPPAIVIGSSSGPFSIVSCKYSNTSSTACPNEMSPITWSSSNTDVATIDATAVAQGVSSGTTTITASYSSVKSSQGATLIVNSPSLKGFTIGPSNPSAINPLQSLPFSITACSYSNSASTSCPSNLTTDSASWVSSNTDVATINSGVATGVAGGTTTISASYNGNNSNAIPLSVNQLELSGATISPASQTVNVGQNSPAFTVTACAYSNSASTICPLGITTAWTSSNTDIATITSSGIATGVAVGSATVTANITSASNGQATANAQIAVQIPTLSTTSPSLMFFSTDVTPVIVTNQSAETVSNLSVNIANAAAVTTDASVPTSNTIKNCSGASLSPGDSCIYGFQSSNSPLTSTDLGTVTISGNQTGVNTDTNTLTIPISPLSVASFSPPVAQSKNPQIVLVNACTSKSHILKLYNNFNTAMSSFTASFNSSFSSIAPITNCSSGLSVGNYCSITIPAPSGKFRRNSGKLHIQYYINNKPYNTEMSVGLGTVNSNLPTFSPTQGSSNIIDGDPVVSVDTDCGVVTFTQSSITANANYFYAWMNNTKGNDNMTLLGTTPDDGPANTMTIVNAGEEAGKGTNSNKPYAAEVCNNYTETHSGNVSSLQKTISNWYLPSSKELTTITGNCNNANNICNLNPSSGGAGYWSSSEKNLNEAYAYLYLNNNKSLSAVSILAPNAFSKNSSYNTTSNPDVLLNHKKNPFSVYKNMESSITFFCVRNRTYADVATP